MKNDRIGGHQIHSQIQDNWLQRALKDIDYSKMIFS